MQETHSFRHLAAWVLKSPTRFHAQLTGGAAIRRSMTPGRVSDVVFLSAGRTACLSDTAKKKSLMNNIVFLLS